VRVCENSVRVKFELCCVVKCGCWSGWPSREHTKKKDIFLVSVITDARVALMKEKKRRHQRHGFQTLVDTVQSFLCCTQGWQKKQQQQKGNKEQEIYKYRSRSNILFLLFYP